MKYLFTLLLLVCINSGSLIQASIDLETLKSGENSTFGVWSTQNKSWSFWSTNKKYTNKISHLNSLEAIYPGIGYHVVGQVANSIETEIQQNLQKVSVLVRNAGWAYINLANSEPFSLSAETLNKIDEVNYFDDSSQTWVQWKSNSSQTLFAIPEHTSFWIKANKANVEINQDNAKQYSIEGGVVLHTKNVKPHLGFSLQSELIEKVSDVSYVLNKQQSSDGFYINLNSFHPEGVSLEYLKVEETRVSHGVSNKRFVFIRSRYQSAYANERVFVNPDYNEFLEYKVIAKVLNSDPSVETFSVRVKDQRMTPLKNLFNNLKRSSRLRSPANISANEIDMIELSVSGEGISPTQIQTYPANTVEAQISIIAGPQRTFLVRYFDQFGDVMKQASTTMDVLDSIQSPIRLESKELGFAPIELSHLAGEYQEAIDLNLSIASGKLFYTLDGTNPKLEGSTALETDSVSIPINATTLLKVFIEDENGVRSGVFSYLYELGGSPTVSADVLTASYQGEYESPVQLRFNSNFANTTIFYSINETTVSTSSTSAVAPFTIVLTDPSEIKYFGESSLGYQSTSQELNIALLPSEFSEDPNVDLQIEGTFFNSKYIWPVDLNFSANLPETKIYYSTNSAPVTTQSSYVIAPATMTLDQDTSLQYFAESVVGNNSPIITEEFIGYNEGEISPEVTVEFSKPGVSGRYTYPVTATFTGIPGTLVYFATDGSNPANLTSSVVAPHSIEITEDTLIRWYGSVADTVNSDQHSLQVLEFVENFYESRDVDISSTGDRSYSGVLYGGEQLSLFINGQDQTQLVQFSNENTGYAYEIPSDQALSSIVLTIKNEEGDELAIFEEEVINPSLNHILGGANFGLPSQYMSLDALGGFGSATFDYEKNEKVFFNSMTGSLFKVDTLGVSTLIQNFEEIAGILQLKVRLENSNQQEQGFYAKLQEYGERTGAVAAKDGEYLISSHDWLEAPINTGQNTNDFGAKIYHFGENGLRSIAGHYPQASDSFLFLKDLIGTNATYVATHTYLGDEIQQLAHLADSVLFIAHGSIFEILPEGLIQWVGGATFSTDISSAFTGIQSKKWDMKAFEKVSPTSIMVSAIETDTSVALVDGRPQYRPAKIYELTKQNGQFSLLEKFTIGDSLVSLDYIKDGVPSAQIPASYLYQGEYKDLIKSYGFTKDKVYFSISDSSIVSDSYGEVLEHIYSINPSTSLVKHELDPKFGLVDELPSPLDKLMYAPRHMVTMGDEILFVYKRDLYHDQGRSNTSIALPRLDIKDLVEGSGSETELGLFNPLNNSVSYFMDGEGEMTLDADSQVIVSATNMYLLLNHEQNNSDGSYTETELIKKPHFKSFDEDESGVALSIPEDMQVYDIVLANGNATPTAITRVYQDTFLTKLDVSSGEIVSLTTSPAVFGSLHPDLTSTLPAITITATGHESYDTLAYAADNNLSLSEISLPGSQYLSINSDSVTQDLYILVQSDVYSKLYKAEPVTNKVSLIIDFNQTFVGEFGEASFQGREIDIKSIIDSNIFFTHLGGVFQYDVKQSVKTILYVNSSLDSATAQLVPERSANLAVEDLKFSLDNDSVPYVLFNYPLIDGKRISGISKGMPKPSNILFSFPRKEQQLSSIQSAFNFDQRTIQELVQASTRYLDQEAQTLLSDVSNFIAVSFGELELINAPTGVYLKANGALDSKFIAIDPRPAVSTSLVIANLTNSSGTNVAAKDILSFNYSSSGGPIDLYATIGNELVAYNQGSASLQVDPYVASFSTRVLQGAVGVDILGRKTEAFSGLDTNLSYQQNILNFVPQASEITIETDLQEPVEFRDYISFSVESTPFSTMIIVTLLSNNQVVEVFHHRMNSYDDKSQGHVFLNLPSGVDQIKVEVSNPNGVSGTPIVYDLLIKKFTTISGAYGSGYGADHAVVDPLRSLKYSGTAVYPDLFAEGSPGQYDLNLGDLYHIDQNQTVQGSAFYAAFLDEFGELDFEKVLSYSDIVNTPAGTIGIESVLNSETSSYETLIELETEDYGIFKNIKVMEAITKLDGDYKFISYVNGFFYMLGKTLDHQGVIIKTDDFTDFTPYFLVDANGLLVGATNNFMSYDENSNALYIGVQTSTKAHLFKLDTTKVDPEPIIMFTQDLTLNNTVTSFYDDDPRYLNGSQLYGFFAAFTLDTKLYVGLNVSNYQSGGVVVEIQPTPFDLQDEDPSSGTNKGYFKPFISGPQHLYFDRHFPREMSDRHSNGTKSIIKQGGRLFRLDFSDNFLEIVDGRQVPVIVGQEQRREVEGAKIQGYDPYDFRDEIDHIAPNYSRLDDGLFIGLKDNKLSYYSFPNMKIFSCDDFGQYQEIKANANGTETLVSNKFRNIYHVDVNDSQNSCRYYLKYSIPKSIVGTGEYSFTQISSNELYIAQGDKISYWNTTTDEINEILSLDSGTEISGLVYHNGVIFYLYGDKGNDSQELYALDLSTSQSNYISGSTRQVFAHENKFYYLEYTGLYVLDPNNGEFSEAFRFGDGTEGANQQTSLLNDIQYYKVSSIAPGLNRAVAYISQMADDYSQIKKVHDVDFTKPVISTVTATHNGISGNLVNGDVVTFTAIVNHNSPVVLNARFNGSKLNFVKENSDTYVAEYEVGPRSIAMSSALSLVGLRAIDNKGQISDPMNVSVNGLIDITPTYTSATDLILRSASYIKVETDNYNFQFSVENMTNTTVNRVMIRLKANGSIYKTAMDLEVTAHSTKDFVYNVVPSTVFSALNNFDPSILRVRAGVIPQLGDVEVFEDRRPIDNYIVLEKKEPIFTEFNDVNQALVIPFPAIDASTTYYVVRDAAQGPTSGVYTTDTTTTTLTVKVLDSQGVETDLVLRAQRDANSTNGNGVKYPMNNAKAETDAFGNAITHSSLVLSFHPEDNQGLASGETFETIGDLVIDAHNWHLERSLRNTIYIKVKITTPQI
ncbi:MAG: chitobiase/beta-hexosaminidase C-terminal domain-containing protein [Candidatus Cloacimonetes bacterium]|nr:chitobiase/beta-hexosaminidase C-terminal domain-containing protein [Candidatus Cloacimonadota bacterium]